MKKQFIITALLCLAAAVNAQNTIELEGSTDRVKVQNYKVANTGEKTLVTMDFILDQLQVPSSRYRAFTPVIVSKDGSQQQRLKSLLVTGRNQNIIFEREGIDPLYKDNCETVRRLKNQPQTYSYSDVVEHQPWHNNAEVVIESDYCGCGDQLSSTRTPVGTLLPPDPYDLMALTNITPAAEVKQRSLHGTAYVTFVVDRWEMKPDYMNNRRELKKITDTLDVMVADKNVSVNKIKIHGWASPESPYEHNKMLATNRAKSLTQWVKSQYSLPSSVFAPAEATPENWSGLKKAVKELGTDILPHKSEILDIIDDSSLSPDPKEAKIKRLYPAEYRYLLKEVYPWLRRSDYEVTFKFRDFTLAEAKEVYKTRPYQLSLRELCDVANTYEPYSDEYNRVMQTAYNIYPESTAAQVNLANVAIKQKDLLKAESLIENAKETAEVENTKGVIATIKKDYDAAQKHFQKAQQLGANVSDNLKVLQSLR